MFSKQAIKAAIEAGLLTIDPFDERQIETAHINLHLASPAGTELVIAPKGFVVAQTLERITLAERLCALVEGRATLAKQGLSVEQSSTFVEPGTDNQLTLELFNAGDKEIRLRAGQEIAKLFVLRVIDSIEGH